MWRTYQITRRSQMVGQHLKICQDLRWLGQEWNSVVVLEWGQDLLWSCLTFFQDYILHRIQSDVTYNYTCINPYLIQSQPGQVTSSIRILEDVKIKFIHILQALQYKSKKIEMSKNKGKDKKNDATSAIQKQLQIQKRDIIEYEFTIKKLQQRLADKVVENDQLRKQLEQVRMMDKETIEILNSKTEYDEKILATYMNKISDLDLANTKLLAERKSLEELLHQERLTRQTQVQALKFKVENQPKMLLKQIEDLKQLDRQKFEVDILNLKDLIEYEKAEKTRELADKERQKVQATDKLRDEMLKKIREMKANLLSLKKEQLSTTTRLTILQNHQLTSQLEYQSKQTEKLIYKEEQMNEKIKQLTQQLAIHKQVEEELAKRSHFSKGVIKKLNERIAQLEKQLENSKNSRTLEGKSATYNQNSGTKSKIFIEAVEQTNGKEILGEVERQLSMTEKKYSQAQSKLLATEKERDSLLNQAKRYENSCNQLVKILITYSEEILNKNSIANNSESLLADAVLRVDLQELRNKKIDEWSDEETSLIVKVLLNLIKPYLTKKNILIPAIRRLLVVEDSRLEKTEAKLPKISIEGNQNAVKGLKDLPTNIASKIVGSNLRQWGNTVNLSQNALLKKKYKISQSHR